MRAGRVTAVAGVLAVLAAGCSGDDEPEAAPRADPTASSPSPSASEEPTGSPTEPGEGGTPAGFEVVGIDCGLLDQTDAEAEPGSQDDTLAAGELCIANALRTGQSATFRLITSGLEVDPVYATYVVEGPGELTITEDHGAVVVSGVDRRTKRCTEARGLQEQGNCTTQEDRREG
ncbi:MAG: hypothetical protein Q8Q02_14215 [Nocardioides sp.]|nr:hypothetical protein [Nocardioides sp.]